MQGLHRRLHQENIDSYQLIPQASSIVTVFTMASPPLALQFSDVPHCMLASRLAQAAEGKSASAALKIFEKVTGEKPTSEAIDKGMQRLGLAIQQMEASAFAKESGDLKTNTAAVGKAVAALEKGQSGGFLQTEAASVLKNLVETDEKLVDADREDLTAFLSGGSNNGSAPQSGAITGILK